MNFPQIIWSVFCFILLVAIFGPELTNFLAYEAGVLAGFIVLAVLSPFLLIGYFIPYILLSDKGKSRKKNKNEKSLCNRGCRMFCQECDRETEINWGEGHSVLCEECSLVHETEIKKSLPIEISQEMLVECTSCQKTYSKRAKACPKCGNIQKQECYTCKRDIPIRSTECPECGDPEPFAKDSNVQEIAPEQQSSSVDVIPSSNSLRSRRAPKEPEPQKKKKVKRKRKLLAFTVCAVVVFLFQMLGVVLFAWKQGGGLIPQLILLSVVFVIWYKITKVENEN